MASRNTPFVSRVAKQMKAICITLARAGLTYKKAYPVISLGDMVKVVNDNGIEMEYDKSYFYFDC